MIMDEVKGFSVIARLLNLLPLFGAELWQENKPCTPGIRGFAERNSDPPKKQP
jgi:hypothetical protein